VIDPRTYSKLHIESTAGRVRARASREDPGIKLLFGMLASLAIVPVGMVVVLGVQGELETEVLWLTIGGVTGSRDKYWVKIHTKDGRIVSIGTFGSDKIANQLVGLCRNWQDGLS